MNIHFFGHSATRRRQFIHNEKTFCDVLLERYSPQYTNESISETEFGDPFDLWRGVAKCSEERILFYLKKLKIDIQKDIVIIFHGAPRFVFCPVLEQDFVSSDITAKELKYIKQKNRFYNYYPNFRYKLPKSLRDSAIPGVHWTTLWEILKNNRQNFYHQDLQQNRYNGALMQIDQYITAKKIKAIHCIHPEYIPSWFKFTSGIVDIELIKIQYTAEYVESYSTSSNGITNKGNKIIEKKLNAYIKQLINDSKGEQ